MHGFVIVILYFALSESETNNTRDCYVFYAQALLM